MLYYYKIHDKLMISEYEYRDLKPALLEEVKESNETIYLLKKFDPLRARRSFAISDPSLFFLNSEGVELLKKKESTKGNLPSWLISKINKKQVMAINTEYPSWKEVLRQRKPKKWKVNVFGLGDVGGTLITGLRLMGGDCISQVGIYDRRINKVKRWVYETNQILSTSEGMDHPPVKGIDVDQLFDCDIFVFCASVGVPPVGEEKKDVRMIQLEGNSEIIGKYAKMARKNNFKGIFAVVSDPVDLLCKSVLIQSNTDENGNIDFKGLAPEQIRGYGLGVMNARAAFYDQDNRDTVNYLREGRAYGPHGEGLIIANSIENYNDKISKELTDKTKKANLQVREAGFKPYIAPALSSGALSILATVKGEWHYSATFMGGVYMGARNRLTASGTEIERVDLPNELFARIKDTYIELEKYL